MKKIVDVENEGMVKLLGKRITLYCANYIYTGVLEGVNTTCVLLSDAAIVYETGPFSDRNWKDAQKIPAHINTDGSWYVQLNAIESFGLMK